MAERCGNVFHGVNRIRKRGAGWLSVKDSNGELHEIAADFLRSKLTVRPQAVRAAWRKSASSFGCAESWRRPTM